MSTSQRADDVHAVHVRQAKIEDDQIRVSIGRGLDGSATGAGSDNVVLPRVKVDLQGA